MIRVAHDIDNVPTVFDTSTCEIDPTGALTLFDNPNDLNLVAVFAPGAWGALVVEEE